MRNSSYFVILFIVATLFLPGHCSWALPLELENRISESTRRFKDMMDAPDGSIPSDLFGRSRAVVIFPSVIKAGLGVGGQYGTGVVSSDGILPLESGGRPRSSLLSEAVSGGRWVFRPRIWCCW